MDSDKPFPPVHYSRSKKYHEAAVYLRELGDLCNKDEILNRVGISGSIYRNYKTKEGERIRNYIENMDGELSPSQLLDLLIEKLNPNEIVEDRLYSIRDARKFIKKGFNPELLIKLIKKDRKIKTYRVGNTACILGKDIPYLEEIMRRSKRIDKRFKHRYSIVEDGIDYVSVIDIAGGLDMHLSVLDKRLEERPEAKKMIYRTLKRGKRMVRKEDEKKFIEIVTKPGKWGRRKKSK